jgi:hypothetical protein
VRGLREQWRRHHSEWEPIRGKPLVLLAMEGAKGRFSEEGGSPMRVHLFGQAALVAFLACSLIAYAVIAVLTVRSGA